MAHSNKISLPDGAGRWTRQRKAIYSTLRSMGSHPTAKQLYAEVQHEMPRLSLATVYNTLEALHDAGLIQRMPMKDGGCRYDANISEHVHLKVEGRETTLEDVPDDLGRALLERVRSEVLERIEHKMGVSIDAISVQLHGRAIQNEARLDQE